ncbi:MAG: 50S ribosomal protein L17, partial [Candidatus Omnitrophota bacterium]
MRHSRRNKKFDRPLSQRQAMFKSLARNVLIAQKIETTLAKAKEARRLTEKLITLGKEDTLKNRRLAFDYLQDRTLVKTLFTEIAPLFKERAGGYTRIVKTTYRPGDGASMVIFELVEKTKAHKAKKAKSLKPAVDKKSQPEKETSKEEKSKSDKSTKVFEKKTSIKSHEDKKGIVS